MDSACEVGAVETQVAGLPPVKKELARDVPKLTLLLFEAVV